jgi:hypothetical protein
MFLGQLKKHRKNILLFLLAFVIMAIYLKTFDSMAAISGDAASIWQTIKSYYSGKMLPSYVMYKGFLSVFPYVWLYQLSLFFHVGDFFFVKLYHCLLFAYIVAIGFPCFVSRLLHKNVEVWKRITIIFLLFFLWKFNIAFSQIMVDLPSLTCFLLLVNSVIHLAEKGLQANKIYFIYTGLLFGLNLCFSGQYTLATICVFAYVLIKLFPVRMLRDKAMRLTTVLALLCLIIGIVPPKAYNTYFEKTVVQPFRDQGVWLPTSQQWAEYVFLNKMFNEKSSTGAAIPDHRGDAILQDYYGEEYKEVVSSIQTGGGSITFFEYLKISMTHPVDSLSRWFNRLFLSLSLDNGRQSISSLFLAYTALFTVLLIIKKKCKTVKEFFSPTFVLISAFVCAVLPICATFVELRYCMVLQGLIIVAAVFDDTIWDGIKSFWDCIKKGIAHHPFIGISEKRFPYTFALYCIFLLICFIHYAAIYENVSSIPSQILFTW